MSLWGNVDYATGNNKPLYANTSNTVSNSTINGSVANTNAYYGDVFGVSATEKAGTEGAKTQHAGWVSRKVGTGPIASIAIVSGGAGYNAAGYLTVTDNSVLGTGTGANVSFTIANTRNTMQSYSTNAAWNVINSIVINSVGSGYSDSTNIELASGVTPISEASYTITLGGRGDRVAYETLVAMRSISGDDPKDNSIFSGI